MSLSAVFMAALCFSGTRNHKYHFTMNLYTTYHVMHLKVMIEASVSQNKLATKFVRVFGEPATVKELSINSRTF